MNFDARGGRETGMIPNAESFAPVGQAVRTVSVDSLIATFDTHAYTVSRALRQMRETNPEFFYSSALRIIATSPENSGTRFLATLIPVEDPILEIVANPLAFDLAGAKRIVEALRKLDSLVESRLLRLISANPSKAPSPQTIDRILDIADEFSEGARLVPVLMQVFRTADVYSRARLALSIGKHHRNKDWLEARMRDPDPRVRANAVEANWKKGDDTAIFVFKAAIRDEHSRVIGNGVVGLYYLGHVRILRYLTELLNTPNPHCRAAAIWAIGHLAETRFEKSIARCAGEKDLLVRRCLVVTQAQLKRAAEIRAQQPKLNLSLIKATRQAAPGCPSPGNGQQFQFRVYLEVGGSDGPAALTGLQELQFHLLAGDQPVLDYSVQERSSKAGSYDIYFSVVSLCKEGEIPAPADRIELAVVAAGAIGEISISGFREPDAKPELGGLSKSPPGSERGVR